jgi:spoIIIJ-associated protein
VSDLTSTAQQKLEDLLAFFGFNTTVTATRDDTTLDLAVDTEDSGRLIGHRGETLEALQHVMNMIMKRETTERIYVHIDVAGYKKARADRMVAKAKEIALQVKDSGREVVLPPMSAAERRLVHMELRDMDGIETESQGEGSQRRLIVRKA